MRKDEFLGAAEAAAFLGVTRQTLYAYVSRGLVASEPAGTHGGSRAHRYSRRALERLRDERSARRTPGRGALRGLAPVLETSITAIDTAAGTLAYRGLDAVELSRSRSLEEVAALLWTGDANAASRIFDARIAPGRPRRPIGTMTDRLVRALVEQRSALPVTLADPGPPTLRAAALTVTALFDAVGARGKGTLAERLARGWRSDAVDDVRAALVLCADHGLATSTFTARCVASTDASIANVVLAALCALEGRRHGGTSVAMDDLLVDVERDGARTACGRLLERTGQLPGWNGGAYVGGDPRARELIRRIAPSVDNPAGQLIAHVRALGTEPTLELALSALSRARAFPPGATFALFALGRSVGWIAHALEQASQATLIRPRAAYVGP